MIDWVYAFFFFKWNVTVKLLRLGLSIENLRKYIN